MEPAVQTRETGAVSPQGVKRFHVLINAGSGGAMKVGAQKFESLRDKTTLDIESFSLLAATDFSAKLDELLNTDTPILIGGGDGTIAHAAQLHMEKDKPFGILPMGTMNLLAKDLGIPTVLDNDNIFDLYKQNKVMPIDVGMANDHPFLCCAAIGTIPEASVFRENIRNIPDVIMLPRLTAYVMNQMDVTNMRSLQVVADGREMSLETAALVISNNRFAHADEAGHKLAKSSLQGGTLGIYSASPQNLFERIRLLMHLSQGTLETEPSIQESQATQVFVKTGNEEELVSVDGEPIKMQTPLSFRILSGAVKMIIPVQEGAVP